MGNCPHGKNLSNQSCKYCSCPHGKDTSTCPACQAVAVAGSTGPPPTGSGAMTQHCTHGVPHSMFCSKCMVSGAYGMSGGFNARMPDDFGLSAEEKMRRQIEREYQEKVAGLEKVPGALRMFRTWSLDEHDNMRAMVATYTWKKGENIATSMAENAHSGFYGFSSLAELQKQEEQWWRLSQTGEAYVDSGPGMSMYSILDFRMPTKRWYISGTFLAYGHIKIAEHGGRSKYAVPEYIIEPDGSDPDFGMRIMAVAEKYGMELISVATARELKVGAVPWWRGKPNA